MSRFARNRIILAIKETTCATFASPGASDAILAGNIDSTPLDVKTAQRNFVRGYLGAAEQLVTKSYRRLKFDVEAVGSGTLGAVPGWNDLLTSCACLETIAAARVDYTPITNSQDSLSLEWHEAGARRRGAGARGDLSLAFSNGDIPTFSFDFQMLDNQGGTADTATSAPTGDFSAFKTPEGVSDGVTALYIGATVNTSGAPVITGGTVMPCGSFKLNAANQVAMPETFGTDAVDVNDRNSTIELDMDFTAAQEVAQIANMRANTAISLVLAHGTVANRKVMVVVPAAKYLGMQPVDVRGYLRMRVTLQATPVTGNDEWRITTSYA